MSKITQQEKIMYQRPQYETLKRRLNEPVRFINIIAGPRQVGKTTIVRSLIKGHTEKSLYISVDDSGDLPLTDTQATVAPPSKRDSEWLKYYWGYARACAVKWLSNQQNYEKKPFVFALDEIQKISNWSEVIKGLWDSDRANGLDMHVILLGSAPLLMQKGLSESLAGRYEVISVSHWGFTEMQMAFDFSLEEYIYFGGYPGSAGFIRDEPRWRSYLINSLIKPNIEKDILDIVRIKHPHLLKELFELGCHYSGRELSLTKMIASLNDAKHTETLADYLELLNQVKLLAGLNKYAAQEVRKRNSVPKLNIYNTGLVSAINDYTFAEAQVDRSYWGRLVESSVGAHLLNTCSEETNICYWRDGSDEVDFVVSQGRKLAAIEVKSSSNPVKSKGLDEFCKKYTSANKILVGKEGVSIAEFLSYPTDHWLN